MTSIASHDEMTARGRVWKFGDQVSGDAGIIDFSAVRDGFGKAFDETLLREMCFRRLNPRPVEED